MDNEQDKNKSIQKRINKIALVGLLFGSSLLIGAIVLIIIGTSSPGEHFGLFAVGGFLLVFSFVLIGYASFVLKGSLLFSGAMALRKSLNKKQTVVCPYCGITYSSKETKCPNCGGIRETDVNK